MLQSDACVELYHSPECTQKIRKMEWDLSCRRTRLISHLHTIFLNVHDDWMLLQSGPHGLLVLLLLSKKPSRSTSTSKINAWLIGWARWMWRNGSATSGRTTCPTGGIVVGAWNLQGLTVRIDGRMQIARPMSSPLTWWAPIQLAEMMVENGNGGTS